MDDGLVLIKKISDRKEQKSLNPCCSGRWSRTTNDSGDTEVRNVLILVVVDDGLVRVYDKYFDNRQFVVLILVVVDDGLVHQLIIII